jgi:phosphoribosylglycinamide formyltransferase-1
MEKKKLSLGVLVSGSGSNLQSIIDNIESGILDASIEIVISNNPNAFALERVRKHNIKSIVIDHSDFDTREAFDQKMIDTFTSYSVDLIVMAGFMRILSPLFLRAFPMKIINIHPAILPSFQGLHSQERAFNYGVKFSGCTVHFADEGVDTGPIIIQAVVPVFDDDSAETLQKRILKEEHRIYPQAIQLIAEGKVEISGRRVKIRDHGSIGDLPIHNPPLRKF